MRTTAYLQVEPDWHWAKPDRLVSIRARRITQKRPESPIPGSVVVKITLDIPDVAFMPLTPEAEVQIPVSHTEPVKVESSPVELVP